MNATAVNPDPTLSNPPRQFTVAPFWFWNDDLDATELRRQMADFQAHGVHAFVIHPRVGLPAHQSWMSETLLSFYELVVQEAKRRDMQVWLYDEGMYPSGSSGGQVVAENPAWAARCLISIELQGRTQPALPPDHHLVAVLPRASGGQVAIVDRPADTHIRGLHFLDEAGEREQQPPAADLLNPQATAAFRRLVYDRFAQRLGRYFGSTIPGIFTDEPNPIGRGQLPGSKLGSAAALPHLSAILGYDFTPHLPALWYDDEPDALAHRADYSRAIHRRLHQTYYQPLYEWCAAHGVAFTGHPSSASDIGSQRWLHVPGQDSVWRWVLPGPTAVEGEESTQAKVSSSAMIHGGKLRNGNECCGAYGHELTWQEMCWLANWCLVRGVNLLFPHAFYYSVRGPRRDERPPDVGPNSPWWDRYKDYADYCRRVCWLNSDSTHICRVAVLADPHDAPWRAAKILYEHQIDFNYLDADDLGGPARCSPEGIDIAGMHYDVLIVDGELPAGTAGQALQALCDAGRVLVWRPHDETAPITGAVVCTVEQDLIDAVHTHVRPDVTCEPASPPLRVRHVVKDQTHYYLLFNESLEPLTTTICVAATGRRQWLDLFGQEIRTVGDADTLTLPPASTLILRVGG